MMDAHDTNQPLNQGELEEEKKTVEVSEAITETPSDETTAEVRPEASLFANRAKGIQEATPEELLRAMRSTIAVCNLPWITCVIPFRNIISTKR